MVYSTERYWVFGAFPSSGVSTLLNTGRWKKSKNPETLCDIHMKQTNPLIREDVTSVQLEKELSDRDPQGAWR
jgi:hypothetical protein